VGLHIQDYKSLCTLLTICATLVVPKFFVHFDPCDPKSRSNPRHMLHPCQLHPRCNFSDHRSDACRDNPCISIFYNALKPSKVGQSDLVFGLRRLFTSKCLCARFQVSVSSGYDLSHHLMSQTYRQTHRPTERPTDRQPVCLQVV